MRSGYWLINGLFCSIVLGLVYNGFSSLFRDAQENMIASCHAKGSEKMQRPFA